MKRFILLTLFVFIAFTSFVYGVESFAFTPLVYGVESSDSGTVVGEVPASVSAEVATAPESEVPTVTAPEQENPVATTEEDDFFDEALRETQEFTEDFVEDVKENPVYEFLQFAVLMMALWLIKVFFTVIFVPFRVPFRPFGTFVTTLFRRLYYAFLATFVAFKTFWKAYKELCERMNNDGDEGGLEKEVK